MWKSAWTKGYRFHSPATLTSFYTPHGHLLANFLSFAIREDIFDQKCKKYTWLSPNKLFAILLHDLSYVFFKFRTSNFDLKTMTVEKHPMIQYDVHWVVQGYAVVSTIFYSSRMWCEKSTHRGWKNSFARLFDMKTLIFALEKEPIFSIWSFNKFFRPASDWKINVPRRGTIS